MWQENKFHLFSLCFLELFVHEQLLFIYLFIGFRTDLSIKFLGRFKVNPIISSASEIFRFFIDTRLGEQTVKTTGVEAGIVCSEIPIERSLYWVGSSSQRPNKVVPLDAWGRSQMNLPGLWLYLFQWYFNGDEPNNVWSFAIGDSTYAQEFSQWQAPH
jgi:hypothetical protein